MHSHSSGSFHNGQHAITCRVYYEDTDSGGVVYYANYLRFAERARTEALRLCGLSQSLMAHEGLLFVVRRCEIDYLAPAKLDDVLLIETSLQRTTKVRMSMTQRLSRAEHDIARLTVDIVSVNAALRPSPLPDAMQQMIFKHFTPQSKGDTSHDG